MLFIETSMVVVAGLHFTSYYKGVKLPILRLPIQLKKHQRVHWCFLSLVKPVGINVFIHAITFLRALKIFRLGVSANAQTKSFQTIHVRTCAYLSIDLYRTLLFPCQSLIAILYFLKRMRLLQRRVWRGIFYLA